MDFHDTWSGDTEGAKKEPTEFWHRYDSRMFARILIQGTFGPW